MEEVVPLVACGQKSHEPGPAPPAVTRAIWPSAEVLDLCLPCALQAVGIAEAMGMRLAFVEKGTPVRTTPHPE